MAFAFDVAESDLPLRIAFPLLMSNTLQWLSGENALSNALNCRAGENIEAASGGRIVAKPLKPSDPILAPADKDFVACSLRPTENGFYLLEKNGKRSWVAVNTFSATESDLRLPPAPAHANALWGAHQLVLFSGWPIWMLIC